MYKQLSKHSGMKSDVESILKDITRTFPKHIYFYEKLGKGQTTLFNVLKALSMHHEDSGYVQGMGYITAILLMYMDEERAFMSMNGIFENFAIKGFFLPGMPKL